MDSELRNQTTQDIFKKSKLSREINSQLLVRQSLMQCMLANSFLYVDGERTNLVPLKTLQNDKLCRDEICYQ